MVVKSKLVSEHLADLTNIFEILRRHKLHLNVNPSVTPKRQPPRCPSNEHVEAVKSEVTKLKQAGAIKEVFYP